MGQVELVESYIDMEDWRVKENANMIYSLQGLNNYLAGTVVASYWLNRLYPPEVAEAHREGDIHIHNLSMLAPYCVGWDMLNLLLTGFKGVLGRVVSRLAKHLRTALLQMVNFVFTLQNETAEPKPSATNKHGKEIGLKPKMIAQTINDQTCLKKNSTKPKPKTPSKNKTHPQKTFKPTLKSKNPKQPKQPKTYLTS